ncbi:hypothetical protein CEUSTIGMA_g7726.t1 [Chlamydomonas eustigma]|uniref:UDP-N-acetylglucosamine diphosphorylase n=1 Tax=Chlamydomonas eustigma TaxID=1157962 RepID=A0A250XB26_9CHLO|nr:hypothetical protein CEUSTIGMA_g7726.t1 [Chlamydomonas eustigma]|eukprot:GAX80288.1 hypothetical protein CEUSTIGMA_g7726.t1 [Chlamydomonas eustigma]
MVLLTDVGGIAAFGYTSWQIIVQWYRFRVKNEVRLDDRLLFNALEAAVSDAKSDADIGRKEDYGAAAVRSGHAHIFEDFKKLPVGPLRIQFIEDLNRLAVWSGQVYKDVQRRKVSVPWKSLSIREKGRLVGALDHLSFDWTEMIRKQGADRSEAWLWQLTEPLPMLANEPLAMEDPIKELKSLQDLYSPTEQAITSFLDARRAAHLMEAKDAIQPLSNIVHAVRKLQLLKMLCEDLGLDARKCSLRLGELKEMVEAIQLEPEDAALRTQYEEAEAALQAEADGAAEDLRKTRMPAIEESARMAFVNDLVRSASAASVWAPTPASASRPVATSNKVLRQLTGVLVLLEELVGSSEGLCGEKEVLAAAVKLLPKLFATLSLNSSPNQPTPQKAKEAADAEVSDADVTATPAPSESPSDIAHRLLASLSSSKESSDTHINASATELKAVLCNAAEPLLLKKPSEAELASRSDQQVVSDLVAAVFRKALKASGASVDEDLLDSEDLRSTMLDQARSLCAANKEASLSKLSADAAAARAAALISGLESRSANLAEQPASVRLVVTQHTLKATLNKSTSPLAISKALSQLTDTDISSLPTATSSSVNAALSLANQIQLAGDVSTGLELGPGVTGLLLRLVPYLNQLKGSTPSGEELSAEDGPGQEKEGQEVKEAAGSDQAERRMDIDKVEQTLGLTSELLGDGLVLVELPGPAYKRLGALKDTVEGLQTSMDGMVWNKGITLLKELVGQLGPIGAAVDAQLASTQEEERRVLLLEVREAAVNMYRKLQELISLDTAVRPAVLKDMSSMKESVFSMKVEKRSATLTALSEKLDGVNNLIKSVGKALTELPGTNQEDAEKLHIQKLEAVQEQVETFREEVRQYLQYVKLREMSLGSVPPVCPTDVEVPQYPSLEETKVSHAEDAVWLDTVAAEPDDLNNWCMAGFKLLATGKVAVILIADGLIGEAAQLTVDVGLPSTKPLLQLYAERLLRIQKLSAEALSGPGSGISCPTHWYIMATSQTAMTSINKCLESSSYFGLERSQVHVFAPDLTVPLMGDDGKVLLETQFKVARGPGGSGEVFRGLRESGMLSHMQRVGVKCVDVHAVDDNIMAKIADPTFIGYCNSINLDCAAKVVDPESVPESMYGYPSAAGVLLGEGEVESGPVMDNIPGMVPAIGQYFFSMRWMKEVDSSLKRNAMRLYRLVPSTTLSRGVKSSGYRPDRTITDFILSGVVGAEGGVCNKGVQRGLVIVDRGSEFSPVWGKAPFYGPETSTAAVEDLLLLQTSWVEEAGGSLEDEEEGVTEVSPLVSYSGEGLEPLVQGKTFKDAYELSLQGFTSRTQSKSNVGPWILPFAAVYGLLWLKLHQPALFNKTRLQK